ncbi:MAG: sulfotransferase [Pseudomonadota bacterium]
MTQSVDATRAEHIKRAQSEMQAGRFSAAAAIADSMLSTTPEDQEALYIAAVAARYLGQFSVASNHLNALKKAAPEYGRAYQEEGHLLRAVGDVERALIAFRRATRYNPALVASWQAQVDLLISRDQKAEVDAAKAQLERVRSLPRVLLAVTNHLYEGRVLKAEELVRAFLQKHPHNVEAMRLLADIGSRLGVLEDADILLDSAIQLEPDNVQLRIDYIQVLRKRQKYGAALAQAKILLGRDPNSPVFQSLYAIESMQAGDYEAALQAFEAVLAKIPGDSATLTSQGHALKTYGRSDDAVASYQAAVRAEPESGDAWYALANLKTYRFSDDELRNMQTAQRSPDLSFMSRVHIAFALGKAFEDRGDYESAFVNYETGNRLKQKQTRYTTEQMLDEFQAQKTFCTKDMLAAQNDLGSPAPDPIFIVGLPRAGSTLIEQILASHSQVDGTLELPNILSLAHRLRGRNLISDRDRYPRILAELTADELTELGETYLEDTRIHRQGAAYFTDKMPNNFRHLGLIHLILPNARIIDARRAPMDCCWSAYKQLFAEGQEFSYGLEDIGSYYRGYVDLMDHWDSVFPAGRVLRVQHEDVLRDLEGEVRRILEYCNLPFESACVEFHKTNRAVRTASSEQVRRPINRTGQDQWKPFERFLDPLKRALGPSLLGD